MRIDELSFRHGKEIVAAHPEVYASILAAIVNTQEAQLRRPSTSIGQILKNELSLECWARDGLNNPFFKQRIAIEFEFLKYELIHRNLFRFVAAYEKEKIDAGVLVTCTKSGARRMKREACKAFYENVCKELSSLGSAVTVPLWVIGFK